MDDKDICNERLIKEVVSLVKIVKSNLHSLLEEWKVFQHVLLSHQVNPQVSTVSISRSDDISTEVSRANTINGKANTAIYPTAIHPSDIICVPPICVNNINTPPSSHVTPTPPSIHVTPTPPSPTIHVTPTPPIPPTPSTVHSNPVSPSSFICMNDINTPPSLSMDTSEISTRIHHIDVSQTHIVTPSTSPPKHVKDVTTNSLVVEVEELPDIQEAKNQDSHLVKDVTTLPISRKMDTVVTMTTSLEVASLPSLVSNQNIEMEEGTCAATIINGIKSSPHKPCISLSSQITSPSTSPSPNTRTPLEHHITPSYDMDMLTTEKFVQVRNSALDRLATEVLMLKEFIPQVLNTHYISSVHRVPVLERKLRETRREKEGLVEEYKRLLRQKDTLMSDYEQERKERFLAKNEIGSLQDMVTQQADYCSAMGSACCMLLWGVSRHEECIQSILSGSTVGKFLELVGCTLLSFLGAYQDTGPPDETSPESQFVLSLCGTITNIAASTYGRDFLSHCEDGKGLIDIFCSILVTAPLGHQYSKLRNLILMALYNISINEGGVCYLTSKPKLLSELVWVLQEERDCTNRLHTLRLIQSIILEPESSEVIQRALDTIPILLLQQLTSDPDIEIQNTAMELLRDLTSYSQDTNTPTTL